MGQLMARQLASSWSSRLSLWAEITYTSSQDTILLLGWLFIITQIAGNADWCYLCAEWKCWWGSWRYFLRVSVLKGYIELCSAETWIQQKSWELVFRIEVDWHFCKKRQFRLLLARGDRVPLSMVFWSKGIIEYMAGQVLHQIWWSNGLFKWFVAGSRSLSCFRTGFHV